MTPGRSARRRVIAVGMLAVLAYGALAGCVDSVAASAGRDPVAIAIVVSDATPLRAGPHANASQQALLWSGDLLEVRAERLDHLQVYDHARERAGYVAASRVRRLRLGPEQAPELLAVVRFLRETPGSEALGIGYAAAWLRAAPPALLQGPEGAEALEALGAFADRLAERASADASASRPTQAAVAAHLEAATRHGLRFVSRERDGRVRLCYDGEAHARVLALSATAELQARAALALTRADCVDPDLGPAERRRDDELRVALLDRVSAAGLAPSWRVRVAMRRASLWSGLAYARAREGDAVAAHAAARQAIDALASVDRHELADDDAGAYADSAMRVNASRWAASDLEAIGRPLALRVQAGAPGETCVALVDVRQEAAPLATRCTYAQVWTASSSVNREASAVALAVQPTSTWRELWIFRKGRTGWRIQVLPPATTGPDVGYAEFAGWVPGGRQMLVARESRVEGRHRRSFEVVRLDDLATERAATDAESLGPFQRWQDAGWKRESVALR
ncbi:MAG TPA: hypothetical protein VMU47_15305 [Caldimonas sp.]|nr:hypothetical protein [Caldimonas sp.]